MIANSGLRDWILVAITCAACLSVTEVGVAFGQEEALEEIVVTGTRIARDPNLTGALPVQSVTAEEIRLSGEFELTDVINDIPSLMTSVTSEQSFGANGGYRANSNLLSLRGLGIERTLVLVNGRRHVAGQEGTAAVDIGSIPMKLVERIEVFTGGASAVYGADAVTGVVNFILMDDFEGFSLDASYGLSHHGDGEQKTLTATWGRNFFDDRTNFAISVDYRVDEGLYRSDRPGEDIATGGSWPNPDLRFQIGDIDPTNTPNFARFYDFDNAGLFHYGLPIPTQQDFVAGYNIFFGSDPNLTAAEQALLRRGAAAPPFAILPRFDFPITSAYGRIIPGNPFFFSGFDPETPIDLDNNGTPDCLDSFIGYNSSFAPGASGLAGGCWHVSRTGDYQTIENGLVAGEFFGFGGQAYEEYQAVPDEFIRPNEKITVNMLGDYDLNEQASLFFEFELARQASDDLLVVNSFWDLLVGFPDNPFLPAFVHPVAQQTGGVAITMDPSHFDSSSTIERETTRIVLGLEGTLSNAWAYEVSGNFGRFDMVHDFRNQVIVDRWFAAIDAVTDPATGQPACRIDVDPAAFPLTTPFDIPPYDPGYFSFTPGSGQCVPLNIWAGVPGISTAATDWILTDTWDRATMEQTVFSALLSGDTAGWLELPMGPFAFAAGAEYRKESSDYRVDSWQLGVVPSGSAFPEGTLVEDISDNTSLVFQPQLGDRNTYGNYDVFDLFVELSLPLLRDVAGARELTLDAAARFSDYSTIGSTATWKTNLIYAPIDSLGFRVGLSESVRAPNINELFAPAQGTRTFVFDPCDAPILAALAQDNPTLAQQTQDNCVADFAIIGLHPIDPATGDYVFANPNNAPTIGITSGNPNLGEETARTVTFGVVFEPAFLENFSLTLDYWDISIDQAIGEVFIQETMEACYRGESLNPVFCSLFERNDDPLSPFFGGLIDFRQTRVNFASFESSGYDLTANYSFEAGAGVFDFSVVGTLIDKADFYLNPLDPTIVNDFLGETMRPELAGSIFLNWSFGDWLVGWQSRYTGEQLLPFTEIETYASLYGPSVKMSERWQHDLGAMHAFNDTLLVYGGIKNLTDEMPFITDVAYPSSVRGRYYSLGIEYRQ